MEQTLQPGTTLQGGKYRITRFISSGGFGCTYEGFHTQLNKRIAIKEFFVKEYCVREEDTNDLRVFSSFRQEQVDRLRGKFFEEASVLSQFHHKGIVSVFDVFSENNTAYYVMDFIDGDTLSNIVEKRGPLDEATALRYIRDAAEALKYVHNHQRLHLDIKPGNIMVDRGGKVILIDFGVSKQYDEVAGPSSTTLVAMTPGYAPLEQMMAVSSELSHSTDIYSLGATLYYLLSGVTPKNATSRASGDLLTPLPDTISQTTRNAIEKSMSINRNDRPQSIKSFLSLLRGDTPTTPVLPPKGVTPAPAVPTTPSTQPPKGSNTLLSILSIIAVIVVIATVYFMGAAPDTTGTDPIPPEPTTGGPVPPTSDSGRVEPVETKSNNYRNYNIGEASISLPEYLIFKGEAEDGSKHFSDGKTDLYVDYNLNQPIEGFRWYCANEIGNGSPTFDSLNEKRLIQSGYTWDGNIYYAKAVLDNRDLSTLYVAILIYPESERIKNNKVIQTSFKYFPNFH